MRLFIAIEFPEHIMRRLADIQAEIRHSVDKGRFKRGENFHLTLKFLGEVSSDMVEKLSAGLEPVAKASRPFQIKLGEVGTFGKGVPIRVIWLGLTGEIAVLRSLQQSIEQALFPLGFPKENRPYSPHITLAQDVTPRPGVSYAPKFASAGFDVTEFALVLSEERDRKRIYTPLRHFRLG